MDVKSFIGHLPKTNGSMSALVCCRKLKDEPAIRFEFHFNSLTLDNKIPCSARSLVHERNGETQPRNRG